MADWKKFFSNPKYNELLAKQSSDPYAKENFDYNFIVQKAVNAFAIRVGAPLTFAFAELGIPFDLFCDYEIDDFYGLNKKHSTCSCWLGHYAAKSYDIDTAALFGKIERNGIDSPKNRKLVRDFRKEYFHESYTWESIWENCPFEAFTKSLCEYHAPESPDGAKGIFEKFFQTIVHEKPNPKDFSSTYNRMAHVAKSLGINKYPAFEIPEDLAKYRHISPYSREETELPTEYDAKLVIPYAKKLEPYVQEWYKLVSDKNTLAQNPLPDEWFDDFPQECVSILDFKNHDFRTVLHLVTRVLEAEAKEDVVEEYNAIKALDKNATEIVDGAILKTSEFKLSMHDSLSLGYDMPSGIGIFLDRYELAENAYEKTTDDSN